MSTFARMAGAVALLLLIDTPAFADFPKHTGFVNDVASVLTPGVRAELEQLLRAAEQETRAEIVVATVASLDGMSVEEYANRLFKEWGIGKDAVDNGVLVLIAPNEREMRIEVGYGLEGVLPDGLAGEIIRTTFTPRFRENNYSRGIEDGTARVVEIVKQRHVLTTEELRAIEAAAEAQDRPPVWITTPFFGLFVAIGFFMLGAGVGSKTGFPLLFGSLFGGMPLLMSLIPFFNASRMVLLPLAAGMLVAGFRSGRRGSGWIADLRTGSGRTKKGGWVMGGNTTSSSSGSGWSSSSGSSSSSSGSSSSSSSSFGGGSSGGGGASGRW